MERVHVAVGKAVISAQVFEAILASLFAYFKMSTRPEYLQKTKGQIPAGEFKVPVTGIVKALSERGEIDPTLESRLLAYSEDRHTLIHRWILENGWPSEEDIDSYSSLVELANKVDLEAKQLTLVLARYMVNCGDPSWAAENHEEYISKVSQLFRHAHLGK